MMLKQMLFRCSPKTLVFGSLLLLGSAFFFVACPGVPSGNEATSEAPAAELPQEAASLDASPRDTASGDSAGCQPSPEICNGKDDDCNGQIDEGLSCPKDGDTKPCYTGPANTQDQGLCKAGKQTYSSGQWGSCEGESTPATELCDGKDNDCDGQVDEDVTQACKNDCGAGKQRCVAGKWDACDAPQPETEVCDGKDNNCDGKIDEGCSCNSQSTQPCGLGVGACLKGKQTCDSNGQWGKCEGEIKPTQEVCNNKDDNCDGAVDEGLQQDCYAGPTGTEGKGLCQKGKQVCAAGTWGACTGAVLPTAEICDGKDNDCNGKIDDLPDLQCGQGTCANQVAACANGQANTCNPKPAQTEICNGKDDDCDGNVDDGATCPAGQTCTNGTCQGGGTAYRTGTFQSPGNYRVVGTVSFYQTSSGERIELSANFSSSNGPDLYVYLVSAVNGAASNNPKNYISLGKLKSTSGAQTYTLTQSSAGYKSIVIWCQLAGANFGYANLQP